ncbi:MAG: cob(I)yrinic acid a,c-diamide adenosyltransferase [Candidatus Cloacimonetes bacterium]|jgi:cob(I)alamin adenosyltransferase|nr:cob(I)yrinic acid a,c-diamide adenosyltransferase [Candidatus Cloacimonadota bacterium]
MTKRIYTRTGDDGTTGLFGGGRVAKHDIRVEAYGAVDELNAVLGVAIAWVEDGAIRTRLQRLQPDLFAIGAHLATPESDSSAAKHLPALPEARIAEMETWIDEADAELPPLRVFIMPGGRPDAAALHHARTVCRRAERRVVELAAEQDVPTSAIVYLNRLSDVLFTFARLANHRSGAGDVGWMHD